MLSSLRIGSATWRSAVGIETDISEFFSVRGAFTNYSFNQNDTNVGNISARWP